LKVNMKSYIANRYLMAPISVTLSDTYQEFQGHSTFQSEMSRKLLFKPNRK